MELFKFLRKWKAKRRLNKFINQFDYGFNYFQNRYNPRNYIEVYKNSERKYIDREVKCGKSSDSKEYTEGEFKFESSYKNYVKNMKKVQYNEIVNVGFMIQESFLDNGYIKDNISSIDRTIENIKRLSRENNSYLKSNRNKGAER